MSIPGVTQWFERKPALVSAFLALATLFLYSPVRHHDFLAFDDAPYVTGNVHVNSGLTAKNAEWAFTAFYEANWHPLTWLSHMADCQLFGLQPGPPHLINVALHAANVVLLFWLLLRATGAMWRSFLVAAFFAVHPLNVETVAWVAQRKSLLCSFFCLITIALYGWYTCGPDWKKYLTVVATFALALMSKPMAVSLPIVLLLIDYWPLQRYQDLPFRNRWLRLSVEKLPLALMSVGSSAITIAAQRAGGAVADSSGLPLSVRFGNAVISYAAYVQKTILPANLAVFYPHPQQSLVWTDVLAAGFILVTITAAAFYFRRYRYLAMGWFLFVVTLIPVIGIIQVGRQAMADRYAYVSCIGLFIVVAWGLNDIVSAMHLPRLVPAIASLCVILALAMATARYLQYWQNGVKLLSRAATIAGQPDPGIEEFLADELASVGRVNEAYQHYGRTCVLLPNYATCHYNLAEILFSRNQLREALQQYQIAGTLASSKDMAVSSLVNSGEILLDLGDYEAARVRLDAALQIDPNNNKALQLRQRGPGETH
ncbi:MAG TPA: tetratricopeptide repeat protein [Candidatus Sulfotelmatobacter sp.]|nr:tetratricopeptide repeat protein [Candidatus Sulfotelmatobacter sp.]